MSGDFRLANRSLHTASLEDRLKSTRSSERESTLARALSTSIEENSERIAVASSDDQVTYRELYRSATRIARGFRSQGVRDGDVVAVISEPTIDYVKVIVACYLNGFIFQGLNPRYTTAEIASLIDRTEPGVVLVSQTVFEGRDALRKFDATDLILEEFVASCLALSGEGLHSYLPSSPGSTLSVSFTSGTTALPKGVVTTQGMALARSRRIASFLGLTERDRFLGWAPLNHCAGEESLYATLTTGGTYFAVASPDPSLLVDSVSRHHLTWMPLLPGMFKPFLDSASQHPSKLSSLRFAFGYANLVPALVQDFTKLFNASYFDAYGLSEASYLVAWRESRDGDEPSQCKDVVAGVELRLVRPGTLVDVADGEFGECILRGPTVMKEYFRDAPSTAEAFSDGWLRTGDLLLADAGGSYRFIGRLSDAIKTGGEMVHPASVEGVLLEHHRVDEACVVGVPDDHWGEKVVAVIAVSAGPALSYRDMRSFARERLNGFSTPKEFLVVSADSLPRSSTGKILRQAVRELWGKKTEGAYRLVDR